MLSADVLIQQILWTKAMIAKSVTSHCGGAVALTFIRIISDIMTPGTKEQHAMTMLVLSGSSLYISKSHKNDGINVIGMIEFLLRFQVSSSEVGIV